MGLSACGEDQESSSASLAPAPIEGGETAPPPQSPPASEPTVVTELYTGPAEVEKFVLKFVEDAKAQGRDLVPGLRQQKVEIRIASLDNYGSSTIGLCETGSRQRRVTFDPDFWNRVSDTQKEILAHHELGHCVLYRGHRSTVLSTGAYASIMYPIIMTPAVYTGNYDYYQQELFSQAATLEAVSPESDQTHICDHEDLM